MSISVVRLSSGGRVLELPPRFWKVFSFVDKWHAARAAYTMFWIDEAICPTCWEESYRANVGGCRLSPDARDPT
eukprot:5142090-Pyramimonas_sp.AAC.1